MQLALGFLWLFDGALQLQPFMFTRGFAERVIAPSADGQPVFVSAAVHWSASLIVAHPVLWDVSFATVQLAIGAALLFRRTARLGIVGSVAWSLGVWVLGEGMGGLAGGRVTFLTGAPGAVILYALVGLVAWPRIGAEGRATIAWTSARLRTRLGVLFAPARDEGPAAWVPAAWAAVWGLFALLRALPANDSAGALASQLRANVSSAPGWVARAERALAAAARHDPVVSVVLAVVIEAAVGLLTLWQGTLRRTAAGIGIGVALTVWALGQAFGQIPSGMGTDVDSGPLVALLGMAVLGSAVSKPAPVETKVGEDRAPRTDPRPEAA